MYLPALAPDNTFAGAIHTPEQYFNPAINPNYDTTASCSDAASGRISIRNIVYISHALLTYNRPSDLHASIGMNWGGPYGDSIWDPLLNIVYNALPEEGKFLIFNTILSGVHEVGDGAYKWNARIYYMNHTSYNESIRDCVDIHFVTNFSSGTPNATADQLQVIRNEFAPKIADILAHYETRWNSTVYFDDTLVPRLVRLMYKYTHNMELFYPKNRSEQSIINPGWHNVGRLRGYLSEGINVTFALGPQYDRVHYIEQTAVGDRRYLNRVLSYSTNVLEHLPYTIKGPKEPNATLYGVELEANADYTPTQVMEAQKDLFFCLKQDSSITGSKSQNYEMVTVPCTLRAHKRLWAEFFDKIDYTQFDTSKATGNGMHVHVDRSVFSTKHLNKFTWFFINPVNREFLYLVSERPTKSDLERWAPFPMLPMRKSLAHCSRLGTHINGRIRGTIHYKGSRTVEVRMFKGIVSYATIVKNLEFVDSVVEFTRSINSLQVTLFNYLDWLKTTPKNKYEMLKTFLSEIDTKKFLTVAEVDHVTWGIHDDPEKVAARLNAAPFTVEKAHLTILNKRRKKRIYVLTDGKVRTLEKNINTGVLSKLDLLAQKKQTRGASSFSVHSL